MTEQRAKPRHLAPEYAAQFGDEEVAAAYRYRPPYSPESFAILDSLLGSRPREPPPVGWRDATNPREVSLRRVAAAAGRHPSL
jgi:hypothetical protein